MSDKIIFIQIYIPNLFKKCYDKGIENLSEEEKFLLVLTESDIKTSYDLGGNVDYMEEYIKDASEASRDDELLESYDKEWALKDQGIREGEEIGFEKGRAEGRAEGRADEKNSIAKKLKEKGYDVSEIASITGLSIEKIETL